MQKIYHNIKQRCLNPKAKRYDRYGGRGITLYNDWLLKSKDFVKYIKSLPNCDKEGYTIDRIDNNGNYEPGNLRWADKHTQCANRNGNLKSVTGVKGVYFTKREKKWRSSITVNSNRIEFGFFKTMEEAKLAREEYIQKNNLIEYGN